YCSLCLTPHPGGSWEVRNGDVKSLGGGRYETTTVSVRVPLCGSCRWNLRMREVAAALGALGLAGLVVGPWYCDAKADGMILGAGIALVLGYVTFLVLGFLFNAPGPRTVAYLEKDGTDITFANPEYQVLYTGEARPAGPQKAKIHEGHWR